MALVNDRFVLFDGNNEWHSAYLQSLGAELFGKSRIIQIGYPLSLDAAPSTLSNELDPIDSIANLVMGLMFALSHKKTILLQRDPKVPAPNKIPHGAYVGLQTSGTTGKAKWVFHSIEKLLENLPEHPETSDKWLLSYHPFSFAGIQVLLYTLKNGLRLCYTAKPEEQVSYAATQAVNALSLTPSLFKVYSLDPNFHRLSPRQITFGGEICTQDTLDLAAHLFPDCQICHVYATTETGTLFRVNDGLAGFPASYLDKTHKGWQIAIENHCLHCIDTKISSANTHKATTAKINTGDLVEQTANRILFLGRQDNIVSVGGDKVNLELLEQELLRLHYIQDARVFAKANPITGNIIGVELVALEDECAAKSEFATWSKQQKNTAQPRIIKWVDEISLSGNLKKTRQVPCATL